MFENAEKIFINPEQIVTGDSFSIIHFNDIYNIESSAEEPVGGASRLITAIEYLIEKGPSLVVFSGDALSPSISKN